MSDLISRQAVQEIVDRIGGMYPYRQIGNRDSYSQYNEAWTDAINRVDAELNSLPSAQPTIEPRAKGEWDFIGDNMFMCTSCGAIYTVQQLECLKQHVTDLYIPPYCPNCGADMGWRDDD